MKISILFFFLNKVEGIHSSFEILTPPYNAKEAKSKKGKKKGKFIFLTISNAYKIKFK